MVDWDLIKSLVLVAAGAGITVTVDFVRSRAAARREALARAEDRMERRRTEGRAHAETVLQALEKLWDSAYEPDVPSSGLVLKKSATRPIFATYLLIPDKESRELIQSGMWGVNNPSAFEDFDEPKSPLMIQRDLIFAMRSSLSAYLRGDRPDNEHTAIIRKVDRFLTELFGDL